MFSLAFAYIIRLSLETLNPSGASRAMHEVFKSNVNLARRVSTRNLLSELIKRRLGTNECEQYAAKVTGQLSRKTSNRGLVMNMMKLKLQDAEHCVRVAQREYLQKSSEKKRECNNWIRLGSFVDMDLQRVMRIETGKLWQDRREHNWRKVGHLFQK